MKKQPYVGVSGITREKEAEWALDALPMESSHDLMVGILASWKSIRSHKLNKKLRSQFPNLKKIKNLVRYEPGTLNLVHYCPEKKRMNDIVGDLYKLYWQSDEGLNGFQINLLWPDVEIYKEIRREFGPGIRLVQQVPPGLLDTMTPIELCNKLSCYDGLIDEILLDPSAGTGCNLDLKKIKKYIREIKRSSLDIIGAAGGLGPDSTGSIEELAGEFPDLSIDAQSNLRAEGKIDKCSLRKYLVSSFEIFQRMQEDAFG